MRKPPATFKKISRPDSGTPQRASKTAVSMANRPVSQPTTFRLGVANVDGATRASISTSKGLEGTRPLLVEIEALVAPSTLATPRRNVVGWDTSRLAMLTAVLEARCGVPLSGRDIFLNVAGGLRIQEPAADLAVAAALISSVTVKPLPARTVFFGEVALSAELRQVAHVETRLKEAAKLGFEQAMLPRLRNKMKPPQGISVCLPANLSEFIDSLGGIT